MGFPLPHDDVRRRLHLRARRHPLVGRLRHRPRRPRPDQPIRTAIFSASRPIRSCARCSRAARRSPTAPRRSPRAATGRCRKLSADGVLLCGDTGGFLNGARLKGIHLAIKSGHARGRDAVRVPARRTTSRRSASPGTRRASRRLVGGRGAALGAQLPPGLRARTASPGCSTPASRWCSAAGISLGDRLRATCRPRAHAQARGRSSRAASRRPPKFDGALTSRQAHRRLPLGHEPRRGPARPPGGGRHQRSASTRCRAGVRQSLPALLPRERLRDGPEPTNAAGSSCRSTPRTACTARPATSPIPTRSSRGSRPKAAAGRTTRSYELQLLAPAARAQTRASSNSRKMRTSVAGCSRNTSNMRASP